MKTPAYSFWLMPCAEQRSELEALVRRLSRRCGVLPFSPHATLCSGKWSEGESELHSVFKTLAERTAPLKMAVEGIEWTDHWATFFFLRLQGEVDLLERAVHLVEGSHPPPQGPHLSLLYGLGQAHIDRPALRQELDGQLPAAIGFDRLALVQPATGRWKDVESWNIAHSIPLSG